MASGPHSIVGGHSSKLHEIPLGRTDCHAGPEPLVSCSRSVPFVLTTWITEEQVLLQEVATNAIFRPSGYQAGWL